MAERVFAPCVVIPVYNHEHAIGAVVDEIRAQSVPMVLVDDGSSAACAEVLQRLSETPDVVLVRHDRNRGKGAAVVTGLRTARDRGYTHAVQIDADGQHTVSDVTRFVDEARKHPGAVICGRPIFDASIPRSRYYGRYLTHGLVWLETLSFELIDTMCGFRVYPLAVTLRMLERDHVGARMDFDTEILVRLYWRGVRTRWLATAVRYPRDGVSHYRMFRDNVRMTSLHARLMLGMLLRLPLLLWRKAHA
ncbi:MAG TPA: glycosyltransferase family 2 protein [Steroidobacteraceae bacterium]|nr:glycosyltransferase family 2 protein [Steroidobacteraceae bacterium]